MDGVTPEADGETLRGSKAGITIATMCAAFMAVLDVAIVNVALADIQASLGAGVDQISRVSTGYMMANVIVIPLTGWLQRRYGFRRYFTASILLFTVASILCGLAWNLSSLVLFRVMQGVGGGAIVPTSQAILFARYPKAEHGMAVAVFGIGAITGPLLGPTLGGYLIDWGSWHWIFFVNVPIGLLAAGLAWRHIDQPGFRPARESIDRFGIALLAVGMASLQMVLEDGQRQGWWQSRTILTLSAVSAITLVTFVVHALEVKEPVVDLRVFGSRCYAAATGLNFLMGAALFAGPFLFALYCGYVMRYTALEIGLLNLKGNAIQLLVLPLLGLLGHRIDGRWLVTFGAAMMCLSLWLNGHLTARADGEDLVLPVFVRALGLGFAFVPLSVAALSDLPARARGNAAGLFSLTRELGGSIATAWMTTMVSRETHRAQAALAEQVSIDRGVALEHLAGTMRLVGAQALDAVAGALELTRQRVALQAAVRAFNEGFITLCLVFVGALALVVLLKRPSPGEGMAGGH